MWRFGEERMNLLLCGEAYMEEMWGGGGRRGGWRRGKSDRLDYESTHRRTLFNVSLTFLLSISSPLTLSRWRRMGQGRESGERAHTRVWEETQHSACTSLKVTSPRQSQRSGFIGGPANQRVSKSGGDQVSPPRSLPDCPAPPSFGFCVFLIDHLFLFLMMLSHISLFHPCSCHGLVEKL